MNLSCAKYSLACDTLSMFTTTKFFRIAQIEIIVFQQKIYYTGKINLASICNSISVYLLTNVALLPAVGDKLYAKNLMGHLYPNSFYYGQEYV